MAKPKLSLVVSNDRRKGKTFAGVHDVGRLKINEIENTVMRGDCLDWLDSIPDNSLDMIYIDPPFFTRTTYEKIWGNGWEIAAWEDWKNSTKGDIDSFINYMSCRVNKMKDKLKDTGTFWLECDYRANYRFRAMLEEIFGGNFIGEIVVETSGSGTSDDKFTRKHDTLFVFSKTKDQYYLNTQYTVSQKSKYYKHFDADRNAYYASENLTGKGAQKTNITRVFKGKVMQPPKGRHWAWEQEQIDEAIKNETNKDSDISKKFVIFTKNNYPREKKFWTGPKEKGMTTWWGGLIRNSWNEKAFYDTQKPLSLMSAVVSCGCPEGGIVGDFFAGGGTTLLAAAQLGRKYIGCDVSPIAIKAQAKRFRDARLEAPTVFGFPKSKKSYLAMDGKEFEKFISQLCGWTWLQDVNGQGKGFDAHVGKTGIQIKNHTSPAGPGEVRRLAGALKQSSIFDSAILVAWDKTSGAQKSINELKTKGVKIDFETIEHFLDCFLITEEKEKEIETLLQRVLPTEEAEAA
jgi:DNA modification methylase